MNEASAGDTQAAQERLTILTDLTLLEITEEALALAQHILQRGAIPVSSPNDALHVSVAVVNGIDYLLTWNYKHLANAGMRSRIEAQFVSYPARRILPAQEARVEAEPSTSRGG